MDSGILRRCPDLCRDSHPASDHYSKNPGIYRDQLNFLSIPDEKDHFFGVITSQPFAKGSLAHCAHHQSDFFPGVVGTAINELAIKRADDVRERSKELARSRLRFGTKI